MLLLTVDYPTEDSLPFYFILYLLIVIVFEPIYIFFIIHTYIHMYTYITFDRSALKLTDINCLPSIQAIVSERTSSICGRGGGC